MRFLHTGDWHVGKAMRGRSRADEHRAVLAEVAAVAEAEQVDAVLVAGDLFDTAAPSADSEQIVYEALLALARTGAHVVVVSGNHDNERRLQAVAPLLELGRVTVAASFRRPDEGGVIEVRSRDRAEVARVALLPFLSQRWVVRADELMATAADQQAQAYGERMRLLIQALTVGFEADAVNIVVAHLFAMGGLLGGGEREAQTILDYAVSATAFPANAQYVALGHLHRSQVIAGPCPIRYAGSPLQLDFGETADRKSVLVAEAHPGRPVEIREHPLTAGRRLRTVEGTLEEVLARAGTTGDDYLRVRLREAPRVGLAEAVRERFPDCVDVQVLRPGPPPSTSADGAAGAGVEGHRGEPAALFRQYLAATRGEVDEALAGLFGELVEECAP
jgi:DNA repair protein SbcD/Mre11